MTPEAQRIAIAEACGWKFIPEYGHGEDQPPEFTTVTPDGRHLCGHYPDYLNDLNAMHKAEKFIANDSADLSEYAMTLTKIAAPDVIYGEYSCFEAFKLAHATPAQRAEAFLRTLNLYTDDQ